MKRLLRNSKKSDWFPERSHQQEAPNKSIGTKSSSLSLLVICSPSTRGAGAYRVWDSLRPAIKDLIDALCVLRGHPDFDTLPSPQLNLNPRSAYWAWRSFSRVIEDSDVTHVITAISQSDILYGLFRRRKNGPRWVVYTQGRPFPVAGQASQIKLFIWKWLWIQAARRADGIVAVSQALAQEISSYLDGRHVQVVYPPLDVDWESRKHNIPAGPNRGRVGFVGRLSLEKDPELFCQIASSFDQQSGHVFGSGDLEPHLRSEYPSIRFHGFQERKDIYSQLDVLLVTSRSEGLGLTILEASVSGVVPIVSEIGGCAEAIHPENRKMLVIPLEERKSIASWQKRIRIIQDSAAIRDRILSLQYDWIRQNFDPSSCASRLLEAIK